jgi:hypothetical protein
LNNRQLKYWDLMLYSDQDANAGKIIPLNAASNQVAYPPRISEFNQPVIDRARELYKKGDYRAAAAEYNSVFEQEKQNVFYIYELGLAYYWVTEKRNFSYDYLGVIAEHLSNKYKDSSTLVSIDFTYHELYWKLGTLQLDYQDWPNAAVNLAKSMIVIYTLAENRNTDIDRKHIGFLGEAFFRNGQTDGYEYFRRYLKAKYPKDDYLETLKKN